MPRSAVVVLSVCAVVTAAVSAEAQYFGRNKVHYDRLEFRVLETEHFDIYYYEEEEAATRHAARMAERWYARFSRLLNHSFAARQPLVLYASHPHFAQTNVTSSTPGEGIGGLTERTKSRIAMPFAAGLGETDHVLGHEIAHAFQIDIARGAKQNAFALPGWLIEGMAEFLSLGPVNTHTAMWLRDASLHDALPTLEQLDDPRYFPYRYGHALWAYLAATYGDDIVTRMLRSRVRRILPRLEALTGRDHDTLTREWHAAVQTASAPPAADERFAAARTVVRARDRRTRLHVAPSISPDGSKLMFLSERDGLSLDLFMADAVDGAVTRKVVNTAGDPHFDSLQYIHSAGAWDPEGQRFAFAALGRGEPILTIVDLDGANGREEYVLPSLGEIYNPSWSPDGTRLVFSALKGGLSDLFVYTPVTRSLQRLTTDAFADLHPAWSPDGRTIAFASDRFTSSLEDLRFGSLRIALFDVATGVVRSALESDAAGWKAINPQWAPEGEALYFVSDRTGVSNVYRLDLESAEVRQITNVRGGVSGITSTSPSLAVAAWSGRLAFSVYRDGRYEIRTLDARDADRGRVVEPPAGFIASEAPVAASNSAVAIALADARTGLPPDAEVKTREYDDRLRLESVSQPYVGATTGNSFGGALRASVGFAFGDMLRDRQLQTLFRLGTDLDDLAAQVSYMNRRRQWNWGITGGYVPSRFFGAHRSIARDGDLVTRETTSLRYMHQWGGLAARYNVDRSRRFEFGAGVRRTGFEWQTSTRVIDPRARKTLSRELDEMPAGDPIHLAEMRAAFVHDTSSFGPTSPLAGQRYRVEIEPAFGGLAFTDVRVDYRRYFMPRRPVTVAMRIEHAGRYGPGAADARLTPLVFGLQTLVRGYDLRSFAADECGRTATSCSIINELTGSRLALVNVEVRAPLKGLLTGELEYGGLVPVELIAFADAGFLWTRSAGASPLEQDRFRSIGAGARANVGGIVFEMTAVRPFDRPGTGWTLSFLLRPGF
jgi:Tol biopolymer transport system component